MFREGDFELLLLFTVEHCSLVNLARFHRRVMALLLNTKCVFEETDHCRVCAERSRSWAASRTEVNVLRRCPGSTTGMG